MTTISGGKIISGVNTWERQLYPLSADDRRQIVRILPVVRRMVMPSYEWHLGRALREYSERFARDDQERRLCIYLQNLIQARCFPYIGYAQWLRQFGIDAIRDLGKFQDAQQRWVDALIEEFST